MKHTLGIDPGASGGMAIVDTDGNVHEYRRMGDTDADTATCIKQWLAEYAIDHAWIEKVNAMPKQGVSSTFSFGRNYGFLIGLLTALDIPHTFVRPQEWQKAMRCLTGGDKNISKGRAQQLWPMHKWTHATADAALIAAYGAS